MGAYAVPSKQPFIAKGPIKTKRKRGRIDDLMEMVKNSYLEKDEETGNLKLMRDGETLGVFTEDDEE